MIAFRMIALIGVFVFGLAIVLSDEVIAAPFTRLPASALPAQIGEQFDVVEVKRGRKLRRRGSGQRRQSHKKRRNVRCHNRPCKVSRHQRRSQYRSRHNRPRHHRKYRRYQHDYGGIWYSAPILFATPIYVTPRYNQCDKWSRLCQRNWGGGANYRGCMKYHKCQ
jgi:hypothetical protein